MVRHFNPRPPRGGRPLGPRGLGRDLDISIHAPRAGGDLRPQRRAARVHHFNPRPPRGGRRPFADLVPIKRYDISIHAPRAGGDVVLADVGGGHDISIHAPRAGGDRGPPSCASGSPNFNPRPPRGGRPARKEGASRRGISIHAPRAGGDCRVPTGLVGELISIHAPRAGGDSAPVGIRTSAATFQSTPPARGATAGSVSPLPGFGISIRAPRAGGDPQTTWDVITSPISIHAPRAGGDELLHELDGFHV